MELFIPLLMSAIVDGGLYREEDFMLKFLFPQSLIDDRNAFVLVAGGIMVFVWKFRVRPMGGVWNVYELLPAFIVASVAIVVVSLLTAAPEKEITDIFDEVNAR